MSIQPQRDTRKALDIASIRDADVSYTQSVAGLLVHCENTRHLTNGSHQLPKPILRSQVLTFVC
jgi:hypothetical protein